MKCMLSVANNQQYSNSFLLFQHLDSPSPVHVFVNGIQRVCSWNDDYFCIQMLVLFLFFQQIIFLSKAFHWCTFWVMPKWSIVVKILDFPQIVEFLEMVFCKLNVIIDNPCNKYEKVPVINTNKYSLLLLTLCFNFLDFKN